jgi:hypothetical protein
LLRTGVEVVYSADAVAYHHYNKDLAAVAQDSVGRGRNDVLFGGKHPEVQPHLRLTGARGSRRRRVLRGVLLGLSVVVPSTPQLTLSFVRSLERRRTIGLDVYYDFVLDYFYWLGATAALRERRRRPLSAAAPTE